jgi:hypothetical protein
VVDPKGRGDHGKDDDDDQNIPAFHTIPPVMTE